MASDSNSDGRSQLAALRARGADLRAGAQASGPKSTLVDTRQYNCGTYTRQILRASGNGSSPRLMFRTPELNLAIISKEVVTRGEDYGLRPFQLATKLNLPYELSSMGRISRSGARTVYIGERNFNKSLKDNFFGDMAADKVDHDMRIIKIFDVIPSLDPFLLKDQFDLKEISVNPNYLEISDDQWSAMEESIVKDFRHIVKTIFADSENLEMRTQSLVHKLWHTQDLAALHPLIQALHLDPDSAQETFFSWKGIIFYVHKQKLAMNVMDDTLRYLQSDVRPRFKQYLRDSTPVDWYAIFDRLSACQKEVAEVVSYYQGLMDRFGTGDFASEFRNFLKMAPELFWLLGRDLACLEQVAAACQALQDRSPGPGDYENLIRVLLDMTQEPRKSSGSTA